MEYLEGRTLKYYLKDEEPLDLDNVFAVSIQLAEGLASAHAKGIVHRNLKPGNIFVTRDGSLKLLDFGIAKLVDAVSGTDVTKLERITRTGQILGTAEYMAPEQARGEVIDARADVFSFGCVLYQMLTGRTRRVKILERVAQPLRRRCLHPRASLNFHEDRNHQGKGNLLLFPASEQDRRAERPIRCRQRLGGLLRFYLETPHE